MDKRQKLKTIIEANRISRLSRDTQNDMLEKFQEQLRKAKGLKKERLTLLIDTITEKQIQQDEAYFNQTYADYADGVPNGGGGNVGDG